MLTESAIRHKTARALNNYSYFFNMLKIYLLVCFLLHLIGYQDWPEIVDARY